MTSWLLGLGIFLVHVMGAVSAVLALMSSRTSQGAIAWIVSLVTFPYAALPAYWIFGRPRFYGYVSARGRLSASTIRDDSGLPRELLASQPAPLGPIRAWICPSVICRSTWSTAVKPRNVLVRPWVSSTNSRGIARSSGDREAVILLLLSPLRGCRALSLAVLRSDSLR